MTCPACYAPAGKPCNVPTDNARRTVTWHHHARENLAGKVKRYRVDFAQQFGTPDWQVWTWTDTRDEAEQEQAGARGNPPNLYLTRIVDTFAEAVVPR
jgi:hypothetical protein